MIGFIMELQYPSQNIVLKSASGIAASHSGHKATEKSKENMVKYMC